MTCGRNSVSFSIVIPVFNCEDYIQQSIQSVLQQNYQQFDIVVIDDGSYDSTPNIIQSMMDNNDKITFIKTKNSGTYNARLLGIKHAKGDYVLFLDADDELRCDALAFLNSCLLNNPADMLLYNCSQSSNYDELFYEYPFHNGKEFNDHNKNELFEVLCKGSTLNNLATKCIKLELFNDVNLIAIDHFINAEDLYMSILLISKAKSIRFVDEALYYYRENKTSATHCYNEYYFESISRANALCVECISKRSVKLMFLTKQRASRACVSAIDNVLSSDLSNVKCAENIKTIIDSDFFRRYFYFYSINSTRKYKLLFVLLLLPSLFSQQAFIGKLRSLLY